MQASHISKEKISMINVIYLEEVNSTNTYAKALLKTGEPLMPYTVIYAKKQTAGRGRLGRTWESKESDSLCMSLILSCKNNPNITLLSALGAHKALCGIYPDLKIKWPNDIIADNKKLCGILTEGTENGTVVGIGINLNYTKFPEDIAHKATSLRLLTDKSFDPSELLQKIAVCVFDTVENFSGELTKEAIDEYTPLCANIGRQVQWNGKTGIAEALTSDGSLLISTSDGTEEVRFGEVFISGIY